MNQHYQLRGKQWRWASLAAIVFAFAAGFVAFIFYPRYEAYALISLKAGKTWPDGELEAFCSNGDAIDKLSQEPSVRRPEIGQAIEVTKIGNSGLFRLSYSSFEREHADVVLDSVIDSLFQENRRREVKEEDEALKNQCVQILKKIDRDLLLLRSQTRSDVKHEFKINELERKKDEIQNCRLCTENPLPPDLQLLLRTTTPRPSPPRREVIPVVSLTAFCVPFIPLAIIWLWRNRRRGWRQQFGLKFLLCITVFAAVGVSWIRIAVIYFGFGTICAHLLVRVLLLL